MLWKRQLVRLRRVSKAISGPPGQRPRPGKVKLPTSCFCPFSAKKGLINDFFSNYYKKWQKQWKLNMKIRRSSPVNCANTKNLSKRTVCQGHRLSTWLDDSQLQRIEIIGYNKNWLSLRCGRNFDPDAQWGKRCPEEHF